MGLDTLAPPPPLVSSNTACLFKSWALQIGHEVLSSISLQPGVPTT